MNTAQCHGAEDDLAKGQLTPEKAFSPNIK